MVRHSARMFGFVGISWWIWRERGHGCVCYVYNGAEVSGEVIEYIYENLSFLIHGVEQVPGKSESWTWVDDTQFCIPEAKWWMTRSLARVAQWWNNIPSFPRPSKVIILNAMNKVLMECLFRCHWWPWMHETVFWERVDMGAGTALNIWQNPLSGDPDFSDGM